jgi:alpha-beta hydrolase superfamily lysophospholipase
VNRTRTPTIDTPGEVRDSLAPRTGASRRHYPPKLQLAVLLISFASIAGMLTGCAAQSAGVASAQPTAYAGWPARITTGLDQLAADTPHVLRPDPFGSARSGEAGPDAESEESAARVVRAAACGLGIVLELQHIKPDDGPHRPDERELVFISFSPLVRDGSGLDQPVRLPAEITPDDVHAGVPWHLYEPRKQLPRGLVVHLGGNKYVRRALLKDGWAVLSSPGTGGYLRWRESPRVFEIERGERLNETVAQLAAVIDDELADWAYSLEAVFEYLAAQRPDIPQQPLVIMGFSIGALGLPAVVARMPDRFQAAVIVAGGADLIEIARRSKKANPGIRLEWRGDQPAQEDWQALNAAYLERVKLDPYHTAAAVAEIPVLVCHAHFDQVVPAATGELLHTRLGKPQRFVFPVGHRHLLRIVMRLQAGRIVQWIEAAVSEPSARREADPVTAEFLAAAPVNNSVAWCRRRIFR